MPRTVATRASDESEEIEQRQYELRWLEAVADGDALAMKMLESVDPGIEIRLAKTYDLQLGRIESFTDRQRRFRSFLAQHLAYAASCGARRVGS